MDSSTLATFALVASQISPSPHPRLDLSPTSIVTFMDEAIPSTRSFAGMDFSFSNSKKITDVKLKPFTYTNKVLAYDRDVMIRFHKPLNLIINGNTFTVVEWNANIPFNGFENIDGMLLRHFQTLFSKICEDTCNEDERQQWYRVIQTFDYISFSQEVSPSIRLFGHVLKKKKSELVIEWDGCSARDRIPCSLSPKFTNGILQEGDRLDALVKRGRNGIITKIEEIHVYPWQEEDDDEKVPFSWDSFKEV